jgi:hypothetical protein
VGGDARGRWVLLADDKEVADSDDNEEGGGKCNLK